ncbi:hypothetical protein TcasGA2_TC004649 [Tribolium castaneum]|uniref:Secreted protein n=1 Tax=Tribolium castaneum TaxID=7070 RepID=D6W6I4_TRICA|nr:hypothetical protein TcasGA2_TC004649 [Tribolium castaneum]
MMLTAGSSIIIFGTLMIRVVAHSDYIRHESRAGCVSDAPLLAPEDSQNAIKRRCVYNLPIIRKNRHCQLLNRE